MEFLNFNMVPPEVWDIGVKTDIGKKFGQLNHSSASPWGHLKKKKLKKTQKIAIFKRLGGSDNIKILN